MAKEIKFNVKLAVDGKEQLVTATTSVQELRSNIDKIKTSSQKLNAAFINFNQTVEVIENVTDAIGQLNEGVRSYLQSMAQAAQYTGLQGKELGEVRNQAQALADTFGADVSEVLLSANALAKGFGISAKDALGMVQDGFVAGANANGEFLDTLREYPRYFKEAGLGAEAFVAITANAARQGVFSDKGVDTIKEANLRLREMTTATAAALDGIGISSEEVMRQLADGSTTTFAVMQQVAAKLQELPASSAAVGTAIADIFGSPGEDAGLEYIKTLADVDLSLQGMVDSADKASKALGRQADGQAAASNGLLQFIDLAKVFQAIAPALNVASQIGMSVVAISAMTTALKTLNVTQALLAARTTASAIANGVWAASGVIASNVMVALGVSATGASVGVTMLKVAIRGLLIATGVGAVIAALTFGIEMLMNALDGSTQAEQESTKAAQKATEARSQEESQLADTRAALTMNIAKLKSFNGTKEQEQKLVQQMNNTYGESMGYYSTVSQWYEALTRNSEKYCQQMLNEIRTRKLANEIIELEEKNKDIIYKEDGSKRLYSTRRTPYSKETETTDKYGNRIPKYTLAYKPSDLDKANAQIAENNRQIRTKQGAMQRLKGQNIAMDKVSGYSATPPSSTTTTPTRTNKPGKTDRPYKNETPPPEEKSVDWYEDEIRRLEKERDASGDIKAATEKQDELDLKAKQLEELQIKIGIKKPEQKETLNYMDELRRQLQDAQKNADAATTVKARVDAYADVQRIQGEIDTATRGKLTIGAEAEPAYILQGSTADKRQSYQNASDRINRIKQDVEIGVIGEPEAQKLIDELNAKLKDLKLEPITVELKGAEEARQKAQGAAEAVQQMGSSLSSLGGAVEMPELNVAGTVAQAVATLALSYADAAKASAKLGPFAWIAFAAAGLAQLAAVITSVKSMTAYATGGIVGGNSTSGDRIIARVNSGEMILNKGQQSRLFAMLNGGFTPAVSLPAPRQTQPVSIDLTALGAMIDRSPVRIEGKFRTEGRDLVCAVSNYKKISALSGKRTI